MGHRGTPMLAGVRRASQLRTSTSVCSIQTMARLRTFNPKVVGSSPTGGTPAASGPVPQRGGPVPHQPAAPSVGASGILPSSASPR